MIHFPVMRLMVYERKRIMLANEKSLKKVSTLRLLLSAYILIPANTEPISFTEGDGKGLRDKKNKDKIIS